MALSPRRHALRRIHIWSFDSQGRSSAASAGRCLAGASGGEHDGGAGGSLLGDDPLWVQRQADSRRLMVWTKYYERSKELGGRASVRDLEEIQRVAEGTPHDARRGAVAASLHRQMGPLLGALRDSLARAGDDLLPQHQAERYYVVASGIEGATKSTAAQAARARGGRAKTPGESAPRMPRVGGGGGGGVAGARAGEGGRAVGMLEWAASALSAIGCGPEVRQSTIDHAEARNGLFWRGETAIPGQLVAFYPGVVYRPKWHRLMPGYPLIGHGNPYLILRPDHSIIDGKTWGFGEGRSIPYSPVLIPPWFKRATTGIFESSYRLATPDGHDWTGIDLRNPWARGHFANHPPPGSSPNVIKAAVDLVISGVDEAWARAYFPFLMFSRHPDTLKDASGSGEQERKKKRRSLRLGFGMDVEEESQGQEELEEMAWGEVGVGQSRELRVSGIVLVASDFIEDDQEIFLNYRYNPYRPRPSWYFPVDADEEDRLWRTRGYAPVE